MHLLHNNSLICHLGALTNHVAKQESATQVNKCIAYIPVDSIFKKGKILLGTQTIMILTKFNSPTFSDCGPTFKTPL